VATVSRWISELIREDNYLTDSLNLGIGDKGGGWRQGLALGGVGGRGMVRKRGQAWKMLPPFTYTSWKEKECHVTIRKVARLMSKLSVSSDPGVLARTNYIQLTYCKR
jgi:hypothetical protein